MSILTFRRTALMCFTALAGFIAWQAAPALQSSKPEKKTEAAAKPEPKPKADKPKPDKPNAEPKPAKPAAPKPQASTSAPAQKKPAAQQQLPATGKETPMAQRIATLGFLNKRNGLWRDITMKPGEALRLGDVVLRLRACEKTANWESEKYTGAFVQVIVRSAENKWRKVFSGWLYKESPSLNVVEHPIYDVWVKDCQMRHADFGPNTIKARGPSESELYSKKSESDR